jgi:hypothetical protein
MSPTISIGVTLLTSPPVPVMTDCELGDNHAVAIDSKGILIAGICGDRMYVRDQASGWKERIGWDSPKTRFEKAVVDARERVHIFVITAGKEHHFVVDGTKRTELPLPPDTKFWDVKSCDGEVYVTFEPKEALALGRLRNDKWSLDVVTREVTDVPYVGFDDECRPFVATGFVVWSRGAKAWVRSQIPSSGRIKTLVGRAGKLHVAYEEMHNGVTTSIATAPLIAEE